ncbi:hypothetical protein AB0F77_40880 [Streptomyces sp. NPDC026672]|uniref:hypothetical protein n=1 Tax=unclassified Streptomyces TaxID=2593676 RepID=UPI0033E77ADD
MQTGCAGVGLADRARLHPLYAAGLSSRTVAELLPCVDEPSAEASDAAMLRMAEERDRLSAHIAELVHTRESLDALISANRAHSESRRTTTTAEAARSVTPAEAAASAEAVVTG